MVTVAAASGLVVSLLSVIQAQTDWGVTYSQSEVCGLRGSTVDIVCSFTYPSRINGLDTRVEKTFWFTKTQNDEPLDLKTDWKYSDRVQYHCVENFCNLTITDLRESDAGVYKFRFTTNQQGGKYSGEPGVTLYVIDVPEVSLLMSLSGDIMKDTSLTLTCSIDSNPAPEYTWYKENQPLSHKEPQLIFSSIQSSDSGRYHCEAENQLWKTESENIYIDVKYPPELPSVSVSPSGPIVEGSSVTLNCSSDANPAPKYTWYKENQPLFQGPEGVHYLISISSEDTGTYTCKSGNRFGHISTPLSLDVQYPPKLPSVSVSPSGQIVEGSSVTLSCSSDSNPAPKYTWYKENQPLSHKEPQLIFSSIQSSDSGRYHCEAENQLRKTESENISIDVEYPPKLLSVSVSPSGQMVEGSSVNLTCSSDSNPPAHYTWYKEDEDSPRASGQIFTITDLRPEHSGNYSCEAQNTRGRQRSTLNLTVAIASWKTATSIIVVHLILIPLAVILWFGRNKLLAKQHQREETPVNRAQLSEAPPAAEQQDDPPYTSIIFSPNPNVRACPLRETDEDEDEVEYSVVVFNKASSGPGTRHQEDEEDSFALYSTVNKNR